MTVNLNWGVAEPEEWRRTMKIAERLTLARCGAEKTPDLWMAEWHDVLTQHIETHGQPPDEGFFSGLLYALSDLVSAVGYAYVISHEEDGADTSRRNEEVRFAVSTAAGILGRGEPAG